MGEGEFDGTPDATGGTSVLPVFAAIVLCFSGVGGCTTNSPASRAQSSVGKPPLVQQLEEIFAGMPEPRFQRLTYDYPTQRGRTRTEFTLITHTAACAQLAFMNYLPHGLNPGVISGYSELLALSTVSSNTLPTIRTVQHISVTKVEHAAGSLFPLRPGNTLELSIARIWKQVDASGALLDHSKDRVTCIFRVIEELEGFADSVPPLGGKVFILEQQIRDDRSTVKRHLYFAGELGACVRVVEFSGETVVEERRLTGWTPLLYRPGPNL